MNFLEKTKTEFAKLISNYLNKDFGEVYNSISRCPNPKLGIFSYPCFKEANERNMKPNDLAKEIAESFNKSDGEN